MPFDEITVLAQPLETAILELGQKAAQDPRAATAVVYYKARLEKLNELTDYIKENPGQHKVDLGFLNGLKQDGIESHKLLQHLSQAPRVGSLSPTPRQNEPPRRPFVSRGQQSPETGGATQAAAEARRQMSEMGITHRTPPSPYQPPPCRPR